MLVVEDNRDAADTLQLLLGLLGHEAKVAYDGVDGLQAATAWRPDVVISDIGMPRMNGFELARELRWNQATAATRLIALTGYGQPENRQTALEAGFDDFLTKPADPSELQTLLAAS